MKFKWIVIVLLVIGLLVPSFAPSAQAHTCMRLIRGEWREVPCNPTDCFTCDPTTGQCRWVPCTYFKLCEKITL